MKPNPKDYVILDRLSEPEGIDSRPMFDGLGLYWEGQFFGIVTGGRIYLKTWPGTAPRYLEMGMEPFQPSPTTRFHSYFQVPDEIARDPVQLRNWAREAWQGFP